MKSSKTFWITIGALALALVSATYLFKTSDRSEDLSALSFSQKAVSTNSSAKPDLKISQAHVSEKDFKAMTEQVLKNLPTKAALRALSAEEVHHTPALLMKSASELGDVAEALVARLKEAHGDSAATSKVLQEGITFYQQCMNAEQSPESIRALCYTHYRELRKKSGNPETQAEAMEVPASVRSLAGFLTES